MTVTFTHTQVRSVVAGPLYRVVDTVTAASGIQTQVFVYLVEGDVFSRVASVDDMLTLENTRDAAVLAEDDEYRLATYQQDFNSLATAGDAASTITARLTTLLVDYEAATVDFVGTTTETLSS